MAQFLYCWLFKFRLLSPLSSFLCLFSSLFPLLSSPNTPTQHIFSSSMIKSLTSHVYRHCMLMCRRKKLNFNTVRSVPAYKKKSALAAMSCEVSWWLGENTITQKGYLPCESLFPQILLGPLSCVSIFLCLIKTELELVTMVCVCVCVQFLYFFFKYSQDTVSTEQKKRMSHIFIRVTLTKFCTIFPKLTMGKVKSLLHIQIFISHLLKNCIKKFSFNAVWLQGRSSKFSRSTGCQASVLYIQKTLT